MSARAPVAAAWAPPLVWLVAGAATLALVVVETALGLRGVAVLAAALAAALVVVFFARHPEWIGVAVVVGLAVQPALKFFVSPYFGPAKDGLVVLGCCGALAASSASRSRPAPRRDAFLVGVVLALAALYVLNPAGGHGSAWSNGTRLVLESLALFVVGYLARFPRRTWQLAVAALIALCAAEGAVAILQQLIGVTRLVHQFGYAFGAQVRTTTSGQLRSFGTFDEPFNFAGVMLLGLVAATQVTPRTTARRAAAALIAVGVALSFVRTDILLVGVLAILVAFRLRKSTSIVVVLLAVLLSVVTYGAFALTADAAQRSFVLSLNGRNQAWGHLFSSPEVVFAGQGVGAVGSGLARSSQGAIFAVQRFQAGQAAAAVTPGDLRNVDSSYLVTVSDVGIPGLLLLLALLARSIGLALPAVRRGDDASWVAVGIVIVLAGDALTRSSITAFPYGFIALFLLGSSVAAASDA